MKPKTAGRTTDTRQDAYPMRAVDTAAFDTSSSLMCGVTSDARIVTLDGLRAVQDLRPGDRLVTRGAGAVPVRGIQQHSIVTRAVYILAGSLGHRQPDRDTLLPAAQSVLVRDWRARVFGKSDSMLVTARVLVDGEYVRDIGFMPLTLYRIYCDRPQIIYADGMELGTADANPAPVKMMHAPYAS